MNNKTSYDFPYIEPPAEYILQEIKKHEMIVEQFCAISDFDKSRIDVDFYALRDVIIRVDMRKLYFHIYHSSMQANEFKVNTGLECFWILKLRPYFVKLKPEDSPNIVQIGSHINEKIALHIVFTLLQEYNPDFFSKGRDLCTRYYRELEYSFRFRDLSKESMYLMFDPFYFMSLLNSSISEDGREKL